MSLNWNYGALTLLVAGVIGDMLVARSGSKRALERVFSQCLNVEGIPGDAVELFPILIRERHYLLNFKKREI